MVQPLFFEPAKYEALEKNASEVLLPEDANQWPEELMQEMYKQIPYASDFEPQVVMDRVDAERGFGFGHIELSTKTEIQHGAPPDATQAAGVKSARVPIVIKDLRLQPLDLLVTDDSKVLPLTEPRLRQAIFRPQAFDITGRGPGDMSMIGQLYPPYRQNYGFGGGGATMNVGMGKEGEAKEAISAVPIIHAVKGETDPARLARFGDAVGKIQDKARAGAKTFERGRVAGLSNTAENLANSRMRELRKTSSVLSAILPTIREVDYTAFFGKFAQDKGLQAQYIANHGGTAAALAALASYEPVSPVKLARATLENIKPSVVQLRKLAEGYLLKTASHACWLPEEKTLDRGEAVRLLGSKVVLAADQTGSTTMSLGDGASEEEPPPGGEPELISEYGIYQVQDEKGNHLIGFVFPNLIDIDGTALPIALFTNGSQMAVQGEIAGVPVGEGVSLFEGHPEGVGVFYKDSQATLPLTVKATMASPEEGGVILHAETFDGRQAQVMVQPNIAAPMAGPDGEFLVPDSWSWLPLDTAEKTALISSPEDLHKEGEALRNLAAVTLRYGDNCFSVSGFPVEKLASEEKNFLSLDDTMFLLGGLDTNLAYAQRKLGEAAAWSRPVSVLVGRDIKTAAEVVAETRKTASAKVSRMPAHLRRDLVKEAAVIPDPSAVDTVLSLGFLNPENLGVFISAIPEIDASQMKMCELLLAARLGLADVPAPALEKAVRSTEEVLEGLKILAFQK